MREDVPIAGKALILEALNSCETYTEMLKQRSTDGTYKADLIEYNVNKIIPTLRKLLGADGFPDMAHPRRMRFEFGMKALLEERPDCWLATVMPYIERFLIIEAAKRCRGNQSKMSRLLGLHRNTLRIKLQSHGLYDQLKNISKMT